jgi:hypothetical protein
VPAAAAAELQLAHVLQPAGLAAEGSSRSWCGTSREEEEEPAAATATAWKGCGVAGGGGGSASGEGGRAAQTISNNTYLINLNRRVFGSCCSKWVTDLKTLYSNS